MQKQPKQFLFDLLSTHSPSGHEAAVTRVWLDYVRPFADEVMTDSYGNAFAILNPAASSAPAARGKSGTTSQGDPTVMFEGHSDEIALMVTYIDEEGFLWVSSIGGIDPKMYLGMPVLVHTAESSIPGVTGALAPHMQTPEQWGLSPRMADVYIDIGAANKAEALKLVRVGDTATIDHGPVELLNNTLCARSCDNKIGIWSAAEALRRYRALGGSARVIAASHVQEEVGLQGARMGAFRWDPDVALVVDVTNATDFPNTTKNLRNEIKLGAGPCMRVGPSCHPKVNERLEKVAQAAKIKLQRVPIPGASGTDANGIYPARAGIPVGILSPPNRYMHSPSETVDLTDLDQIPTLMAKFAASLKKGERFTVHPGGRK